MRSTSRLKRTARRAGAAVALAALTTLTVGVGPASAETTSPESETFDLGDLDESGTVQLDAFDPSLGELTGVEVEASADMMVQLCITNTSDEAESLPEGLVSGTVEVTYAGEVVIDLEDDATVEGVTLDAFEGQDFVECRVWAEEGRVPTSGDSVLVETPLADLFSETITDAAALEAFVGPGTVEVGYAAAGTSDVTIPSEWVIITRASGEGEASIQYEYDEEGTPPSSPPPSDPPPDDPPSGGALPDTGGPDSWWLALAGALIAAGGGALVVRHLRGSTS